MGLVREYPTFRDYIESVARLRLTKQTKAGGGGNVAGQDLDERAEQGLHLAARV